MRTEWNTGREYSAQGQPIQATLVGDWVYFSDAARDIQGKFPVQPGIDTEIELQRHVMSVYDRSIYACSSREEFDGIWR
jgi:hypothetical protein